MLLIGICSAGAVVYWMKKERDIRLKKKERILQDEKFTVQEFDSDPPVDLSQYSIFTNDEPDLKWILNEIRTKKNFCR